MFIFQSVKLTSSPPHLVSFLRRRDLSFWGHFDWEGTSGRGGKDLEVWVFLVAFGDFKLQNQFLWGEKNHAAKQNSSPSQPLLRQGRWWWGGCSRCRSLAFGRWHTEGSTEAEGPEGSKNEKASIHGNLRGPQHPPMPPSPPRSKGDPKKA